MKVYLDSSPENQVPELALEAEKVLEDTWNGLLRPLATADAFGTFLDAWRTNDPNGVWGFVTEVGDSLICSRPDEDDPADIFPRVGDTADGESLYDLSGWVWVSAEDPG